MKTDYELFENYKAATGCDEGYYQHWYDAIDNNYWDMLSDARCDGDFYNDGMLNPDDVKTNYHYNHDLLLGQINDVLPFVKAGSINIKELSLWWDTFCGSGETLLVNYPAYHCGSKILMIIKSENWNGDEFVDGFRFVWIEDRPIAECMKDYNTGD